MFKYEPASPNVSLNYSCVPGCLYMCSILVTSSLRYRYANKSIDIGVRLRECFKYSAITEEVFNLNILNTFFFSKAAQKVRVRVEPWTRVRFPSFLLKARSPHTFL